MIFPSLLRPSVSALPSRLASALGLLLALLLAACAQPEPGAAASPPADTTVTDDLGRTVTFPRSPGRLLALAPSLTETVYAVGAGGLLVGASPSDTYPAEVTSLPQYATYPLDLERVVSLRPDVLLATDQVNRVEDADALAAAGVPTLFYRFERLADVPRVLRAVAPQQGADSERPAAAFEQRIAAVQERVAGATPLKVLVLVSDETPYTFGRSSYVSEAVQAAGGASVTDAFAEPAAVASEEWVIGAAPDAVVVLASSYDPAGLLRHHPVWRDLPAVREGRVFSIDADLMSRPGPRLVDGIEQLAQRLHPDRFTAP